MHGHAHNKAEVHSMGSAGVRSVLGVQESLGRAAAQVPPGAAGFPGAQPGHAAPCHARTRSASW